MPKLTINGMEIEVEAGMTILQACEQLSVEVPVFCYHPRLSVAGNCRMCLVEVEKSPKPVASCSMPVSEGMVVYTNTPYVEKARNGVLEFLLINHPLDCPICDQGGECDLQDITLNYSRGNSRFEMNKRAVSEKYMGPLIKTHMTRCIHCTRCVRFATEIAGVPEMGAVGRGEHMEITSYLESAVTSELSGNMIDICPVGALTNKPYSFHGRPWELSKTESIDVTDAVGSNIRIDTRGQEVMRVLPRLNEDINEEWISDKTRFSYDGLNRQRLDHPYIRVGGKLTPCSWDEALDYTKRRLEKIKGTEMAAIVGDQADGESILALRDLMEALGSPNLECRQDGSHLDNRYRFAYTFNTTIACIENADALLLIGTNPRWEATILNARIRKRYLGGNFPIASVGLPYDLGYPYAHLGDTAKPLKELLDGKLPFSKLLKNAKNPMIIIGQGALNRRDSLEILALAQKIATTYGVVKKEWNGFNVLQTAASRVGALDLGFVPRKGGHDLQGIFKACQDGRMKAVYLLGADEFSMANLGDALVIYQGHHGDAGAHRADVILPGSAFTEKSGSYLNLEGRLQRTTAAMFAPGEAKEDWRIIRALAEQLGITLPYSTLEELRLRLATVCASFDVVDGIIPNDWEIIPTGTPETLSQIPLRSIIENYYMTDPISRHSEIMARCMIEIKGEQMKESA